MDIAGLFYRIPKIDKKSIDTNNIVYDSIDRDENMNSLKNISVKYELDCLLMLGDLCKDPLTINHKQYSQGIDGLYKKFEIFTNNFYSYMHSLKQEDIVERFILFSPFARRPIKEDGLIVTYFYYFELLDGTSWFSIIEDVPFREDIIYEYESCDDFFNRFLHNFDTVRRNSLLMNHKHLKYGINNEEDYLASGDYSPIQYSYILSWYVKYAFKVDIEKSREKRWITLSNTSRLISPNHSRASNMEVFFNYEDCALIKRIEDEKFFIQSYNLSIDAFLLTNLTKRIIDLMSKEQLSKSQEIDLQIYSAFLVKIGNVYEIEFGNKLKIYLEDFSESEKKNIKKSMNKYKKVLENVKFIIETLILLFG